MSFVKVNIDEEIEKEKVRDPEFAKAWDKLQNEDHGNILFKTKGILSYKIFYIDLEDFLADQIFISNKIKIKFLGDFKKDGEKYVIVSCKVKKRDIELFEKSMEQLTKKLLLTGYNDYITFCNKMKYFVNLHKKENYEKAFKKEN
ncbi:MAG: hypothetical protein NC548_15985 [Lachnospiraceae bacterium]|nr:hypothetical protein [Lachnospiraceae bacterium]